MNCLFARDEKGFVIKKEATLGDLKKKVFDWKRVRPARQSYFYGPVPLEDVMTTSHWHSC